MMGGSCRSYYSSGRENSNGSDSVPSEFFTCSLTVLPLSMSLPAFFDTSMAVGRSESFDTFFAFLPSVAGVEQPEHM